MQDTSEVLKIRDPNQQMLSDMLVMEMYLDAVFDSNPDVKRPSSDRRAWGVASCLVSTGRAPTIEAWAMISRVEIIGGRDATRDDSKLPPGTVIEKVDGSTETVPGGSAAPDMTPEDQQEVKKALTPDG